MRVRGRAAVGRGARFVERVLHRRKIGDHRIRLAGGRRYGQGIEIGRIGHDDRLEVGRRGVYRRFGTHLRIVIAAGRRVLRRRREIGLLAGKRLLAVCFGRKRVLSGRRSFGRRRGLYERKIVRLVIAVGTVIVGRLELRKPRVALRECRARKKRERRQYR